MKHSLFFVVILLILLAGCGSKPYVVKPVLMREYPAPNPLKRVCILSYGSEFKMKLIDIMTADLNSNSISVTVDSISNAVKYSPADYDAVVLLSSIEGFSPLKIAPEYIIANNYSPKIVYVSMYFLFAAPYGHGLDSSKIDAITSASSEDEKVLKDTAQAVLSKVKKVAGNAE